MQNCHFSFTYLMVLAEISGLLVVLTFSSHLLIATSVLTVQVGPEGRF